MFAPEMKDSHEAKIRHWRRELVKHYNFPAHEALAADTPLGSCEAPAAFDGTNAMNFVDLTNLKPQASSSDIESLVEKAAAQKVAAVCVNPNRVALTRDLLNKLGVLSSTRPICVVGFPLGATLPEAVAAETKAAIAAGAQEVDMVVPVGHLLEGHLHDVYTYISAVVEAAGDVPVKVILETCKLNADAIIIGCLLSRMAGAAFVKTSTGFSMDKRDEYTSTGADADVVSLMRMVVGDDMGVKASGGIKTADQARVLLEAGASRLGASGLETDDAY